MHLGIKRIKSGHLKQVGIEGLHRKVTDIFWLKCCLNLAGRRPLQLKRPPRAGRRLLGTGFLCQRSPCILHLLVGQQYLWLQKKYPGRLGQNELWIPILPFWPLMWLLSTESLNNITFFTFYLGLLHKKPFTQNFSFLCENLANLNFNGYLFHTHLYLQ